MISKVLVANRAEIAIRAFRAAYELGIATVAVYPYEDRNWRHRLADEAYQIGEVSHPDRAHLSVDQIVATARQCRRRYGRTTGRNTSQPALSSIVAAAAQRPTTPDCPLPRYPIPGRTGRRCER
jgi:biotin carboxylase